MVIDNAQWAYESMACFVKDWYRMPGVEDAFTEGSYCESRYRDIWEAYARLRNKLGIEDEDKDVEIIIGAYEDVQRALCCQMYRYGAMYGESKRGLKSGRFCVRLSQNTKRRILQWLVLH